MVACTVQFRSVCTKWKSLLLSDAYWRNRYRKKCAWFFLSTTGQFSCAFDFEMERWYKIPNPAIPCTSIITAAAGNILCLRNLVADCNILSICNPIRKTVMQLPPTFRVEHIHKATMCPANDARSFKLIVAGEENNIMSAAFMNSRVYTLYTKIYGYSVGY